MKLIFQEVTARLEALVKRDSRKRVLGVKERRQRREGCSSISSDMPALWSRATAGMSQRSLPARYSPGRHHLLF
jgi:hypothetical protein